MHFIFALFMYFFIMAVIFDDLSWLKWFFIIISSPVVIGVVLYVLIAWWDLIQLVAVIALFGSIIGYVSYIYFNLLREDFPVIKQKVYYVYDLMFGDEEY